MEAFKYKRPAGFVDLMIAFESRKRAATPYKNNPLNVSLPFSFIDYHKKFRVSIPSWCEGCFIRQYLVGTVWHSGGRELTIFPGSCSLLCVGLKCACIGLSYPSQPIMLVLDFCVSLLCTCIFCLSCLCRACISLLDMYHYIISSGFPCILENPENNKLTSWEWPWTLQIREMSCK